MVLQSWNVDDLRDFISHDARHVRTRFPFAEETGFTENVGIVAGHVREAILDAQDLNSGRKQYLIAAYVDLVRVTVVDDNV